MNKSELLEKIKDLPDDAPITFCQFVYRRGLGYWFQELTPTLQCGNDPADVLALVPFGALYRRTTQELSAIQPVAVEDEPEPDNTAAIMDDLAESIECSHR